MMFYLFIISLFCLGAIFALGGVALGGWLVYRTKRDPYDPLFSGNGKGMAFNVDDGMTLTDDPVVLSPATEKANDSFVKQFAEKMGNL